jgi:uncharacterized membrane protein YjjP (DUF1212 family)
VAVAVVVVVVVVVAAVVSMLIGGWVDASRWLQFNCCGMVVTVCTGRHFTIPRSRS